MNYGRIAMAAICAMVAYMVAGGVIFVAFPAMKTEFLKYPAVYRDEEGQKSHMAVGMPAILLSILVLTVLFARMGRSGVVEGTIFGVLIALFVIGDFVIHNFMMLRIGTKWTAMQAAAYFVQWLAVGVVIGLVYRPVAL